MHQVCTCYSISLAPKIFEKKIKEYPTLIPTDIGHTNLHKLRFKEMNSPAIHVNEVSTNIGDQGSLQSLIESFTRKATHWWVRYVYLLQSWMEALTYFVE